MKKVFVDTWAWYTLADAADTDHTLAELANEQLLGEGYTFVTTNFVLAETITLIRYNLHHTAAVRFWHMLQQLVGAELVELVRIDETHEAAAWEVFERYDDQKFSYTDCTSLRGCAGRVAEHLVVANGSRGVDDVHSTALTV